MAIHNSQIKIPTLPDTQSKDQAYKPQPSSVVILGQSSLMDFGFLRENVIRIPEVIDVLHQAQTIWDSLRGVKSLVLSNCFYRPDDFFQIHPEFKDFLNDLVQYALFNRLKNQNEHNVKYVLSSVNTTKAHLLILNLQSLKEFVLKHPAVRSFNKEVKVLRSLYAVQSASQFTLYRSTPCGVKSIKTSTDLFEILKELNLIESETFLLNLGLGQKLDLTLNAQKFNFNISDSIRLDERLKPVFAAQSADHLDHFLFA